MSAGQSFVKVWQFQNIGRCTWTTSYSFVYVGGEQFSPNKEQALPHDVAPGQIVEISLDMTAPTTSGYHNSQWMFRNPNGLLFGTGPQADQSRSIEFYVSVPTPTPGQVTVFQNPRDVLALPILQMSTLLSQ